MKNEETIRMVAAGYLRKSYGSPGEIQREIATLRDLREDVDALVEQGRDADFWKRFERASEFSYDLRDAADVLKRTEPLCRKVVSELDYVVGELDAAIDRLEGERDEL